LHVYSTATKEISNSVGVEHKRTAKTVYIDPVKRSVSIFGWSTIVVSAILIFSQLLSLAITSSVNQISGLLSGYPGFKTGVMGPMMDMFEYNRIWSIYSICYFLVTLVGGILFVRFRETGRKILEIACWVGILNAFIDTAVTYSFWKQMEIAVASTVGEMGMSLNQLNPLGLGAIIAGFFLWVIPSVGIIVYLRRPSLRVLMNPATVQSKRVQ
jgi:hypothetical protein